MSLMRLEPVTIPRESQRDTTSASLLGMYTSNMVLHNKKIKQNKIKKKKTCQYWCIRHLKKKELKKVKLHLNWTLVWLGINHVGSMILGWRIKFGESKFIYVILIITQIIMRLNNLWLLTLKKATFNAQWFTVFLVNVSQMSPLF